MKAARPNTLPPPDRLEDRKMFEATQHADREICAGKLHDPHMLHVAGCCQFFDAMAKSTYLLSEIYVKKVQCTGARCM